MVILVFTYYLPQLQHHTLSALARVSLALSAPLRVDQLIWRGVSGSSTWSRSLAPRA